MVAQWSGSIKPRGRKGGYCGLIHVEGEGCSCMMMIHVEEKVDVGWLVGCLTVGPRVEGRTTWKEEPRGRKSCRLMVGPRGRKSSVGNLSTNEYKH